MYCPRCQLRLGRALSVKLYVHGRAVCHGCGGEIRLVPRHTSHRYTAWQRVSGIGIVILAAAVCPLLGRTVGVSPLLLSVLLLLLANLAATVISVRRKLQRKAVSGSDPRILAGRVLSVMCLLWALLLWYATHVEDALPDNLALLLVITFFLGAMPISMAVFAVYFFELRNRGLYIHDPRNRNADNDPCDPC